MTSEIGLTTTPPHHYPNNKKKTTMLLRWRNRISVFTFCCFLDRIGVSPDRRKIEEGSSARKVMEDTRAEWAKRKRQKMYGSGVYSARSCRILSCHFL